MQSNWIAFELAIVEKCIPLAIPLRKELHNVASQKIHPFAQGTVMQQHTMATPLVIRKGHYHSSSKSGSHNDNNNSNNNDDDDNEGQSYDKDLNSKKQHVVHTVNVRLQLLTRQHVDTTYQYQQQRQQEKEEKLIAKHLNKTLESSNFSLTTDLVSPSNRRSHATTVAHSKDATSNHSPWRIWVTIENTETNEMYEHFPIDWIENIVPGNRHVLLSNSKKIIV
ncbi:RAP protein [Reticulomyxa filosa]|uniref:RAP protein n=1 Tax=Reticulomyxa filosa TaxID=46433 RepID=X6N9W3_RETFI|nr:RAP protein [Reticulomyxa filosa]|eukprot:ETO23085.1 RAP protein [Reticulomyxa filosa]